MLPSWKNRVWPTIGPFHNALDFYYWKSLRSATHHHCLKSESLPVCMSVFVYVCEWERPSESERESCLIARLSCLFSSDIIQTLCRWHCSISVWFKTGEGESKWGRVERRSKWKGERSALVQFNEDSIYHQPQYIPVCLGSHHHNITFHVDSVLIIAQSHTTGHRGTYEGYEDYSSQSTDYLLQIVMSKQATQILKLSDVIQLLSVSVGSLCLQKSVEYIGLQCLPIHTLRYEQCYYLDPKPLSSIISRWVKLMSVSIISGGVKFSSTLMTNRTYFFT